MEKGTSHYKLPVVKALVKAGKVRATATAYQGARELGIKDLTGMCTVVLALTSADFYKSMTTYADHTVFQDVYHAKTASGDEVYLKLTVIDDVLIVSSRSYDHEMSMLRRGRTDPRHARHALHLQERNY